jgi:hypothetical protein
MAALSEEYFGLLARELDTNYVPHLPPSAVVGNPSVDQQRDKQRSRALGAFWLSSEFGLSAKNASECVVDDFGDRGIDVIYYDESNETLHLAQTKCKVGAAVLEGELQTFCAGVVRLVGHEYSTFNAHIQRRETEIEAALQSASHIKLWVIYVGEKLRNTAIGELKHFVDGDTHDESDRMDKHYGVFGPDEVRKAILALQSYQPVNAVLKLQNSNKISEPRETWYGLVKVGDLVDLHNKHQKALYEKNIRYYLGKGRSDVNAAIQKTLKDEPESFFYLNNGVTALCTEIEPKDTKHGFKRFKVLGLSIVNGAQTVASTAEALANGSSNDTDKAKVMLTLIKADPNGTFGPRVTKARNSQNPVVVSNFASQDPTQERLRQELAALGIAYHYRPEAAARPANDAILLDEALRALSWMAADPRYVVWLKAGKGDVNNPDSEAYKAIFNDNLFGAHLANAVFFARAVGELVRQADLGNSGLERLVYRHGLHAFGWTYLKRLGNQINKPQLVDPSKIPALISRTFDEHRQLVVDRYQVKRIHGKGPLAFFKNQSDVGALVEDVFLEMLSLRADPAVVAIQSSGAKERYPKERLFGYLVPRVPQV